MTVSTRARWIVVGVLLVAAVLIVFLQRQPEPAPAAGTPAPNATLAPGVTPTPAELQAYSEAIVGRPREINPLLSDQNDADEDIVSLVYSGLAQNDASGLPRPALAQSWNISEDGLTYSFALRRDVKWHDGELFTSRDVSATVKLLQAKEFPANPALTDFWRRVTVSTPGDYTVTFTLNEPFAPFLSYTTIGVLPAHIVESIPAAKWPNKSFSAHPIGTGPFSVKQIDAANGLVVLEPFAGYYGPRPKIGRLELRFYASDQAALAAYQRGDVLGVSRVSPLNIADAQRLDQLNLYAAPMSGINILYLNLRQPLFQQKEVRQALLLALDRQRIIDRSLDGQGVIAHSPLLPSSWAYDRFVQQYTPDVEAAKALLAKAGWTDANGDGVLEKGGQKMQFALMSSDDPAQVRVIEEITRQWGAIGVKAVPQVTGFSGLARDFLRPRRFDTIYLEWRDPSADPDLYPLWHSTRVNDEGQNYAGWQNREADELLEEARRDPDPEHRADLYGHFQDIFAEQVPSILINYPVYVYAVDRRVQNVQMGPITRPSDRFRTIANWTVDKKP
jgi:peptide/nickel transport system substrate-binding protein